MSEILAIRDLSGVGLQIEKKLNKAGIHTLTDLVLWLPKGYHDRRTIVPINTLQSGQWAQVQGQLIQVKPLRKGKKLQIQCLLEDQSGQIALYFFQAYPNQLRQLQQANWIRCYGQVSAMRTLVHPEWQVIDSPDTPVSKQLIPIYPALSGLSSKQLQRLIQQALSKVSFPCLLPRKLSQTYDMGQIQSSPLATIHCPTTLTNATQARQQIAIEELLAHHLIGKHQRAEQKSQATALACQLDIEAERQLLAALAFDLTDAQQRVKQAIMHDLKRATPMSRLVQGDVGSGKTIIAACAALQVAQNGWQTTLMAPTEILARQHYSNFQQWLAPFGIDVCLLTQQLTNKQKSGVYDQIKQQKPVVLIATHAAFQETVHYGRLGLVIIDEQHRFGVAQRLALLEKGRYANQLPHQLVMTATPIPRTLAMTVYGDLDSCRIDQLPPGRQPIKTRVISQHDDMALMQRLADHVKGGGQAYWVCPFIEPSEYFDTVESVTQRYDALCQWIDPSLIGIVHGQMTGQEKQAMMSDFRDQKIYLLLATTVIEVGIDVPNANIMVLSNAERYGLSQLHQLRGRIGRGEKTSYCILLYQPPLGKTSKKRLALMRQTQDGFVLAEEDLKLRGPGDLYGKAQTGQISFQVADLIQDEAWLGVIPEMANQLDAQTQQALIQRWIGRRSIYQQA